MVRLSTAILAAVFLVTDLHAQGVIEGYSDYSALDRQARELDASPYVGLRSLGKTFGGREIIALEIGQGNTTTKPAILIIGSTHAPHLLGGELALRIARKLIGNDEAAARLRERFTFYIVPRPNPDASESFFQRPYAERTSNLRPTDDDNDGAVDEDGPDDLNGDGFITAMRVEEPGGEWLPHPDDPRMLVKADRAKGEQGRYTLYTEGADDDGDELFNEDGVGGVNFDRNFTFDYPSFEPGAGPHQVSEVETRAVADFAYDHPNIAAVLSFGVNDNLARPWKPDAAKEQQKVKTTLLTEDAPAYDFLLGRYKELHGGTDAPDSADGRGSLVKWAYFHYGRWAFEARGWWAAKVPPADEKKKVDDREASAVNLVRWFDREKIAGFVEWTRVEHPGFPGKVVEVGGVKPFHAINPPAAKLDELANVHFKFIGELAERLPQIEIAELKVEPLGGGVHRVTVTFRNVGFLPTMPAMGRTGGVPNPLNIKLEIPKEASLITGYARTQLSPIAGGGKAEQVWLIRSGPGELTVTITSPAVGTAQKKVVLP